MFLFTFPRMEEAAFTRSTFDRHAKSVEMREESRRKEKDTRAETAGYLPALSGARLTLEWYSTRDTEHAKKNKWNKYRNSIRIEKFLEGNFFRTIREKLLILINILTRVSIYLFDSLATLSTLLLELR